MNKRKKSSFFLEGKMEKLYVNSQGIIEFPCCLYQEDAEPGANAKCGLCNAEYQIMQEAPIDADHYTDCPYCKKNAIPVDITTLCGGRGTCDCPGCNQTFVVKLDPWRHYD